MYNDLFFNSITRFLVCLCIIFILISLGASLIFTLASKKSSYRALRSINYISKALFFVIFITLIQQINEENAFLPVDILIYFLYAAIIPAILSVVLFIKRHDFIYLIDIICYVLFLPFLIYINDGVLYCYIALVALSIQLSRQVYVLIVRIYAYKYQHKYYLSKMSLDLIDDGLAIQGKRYDEFQNMEFQHVINALNINNYDYVENIWKKIADNKTLDKHIYDQDSYLVKVREHFYLIRKNQQAPYFQIITYCVDKEIEARNKIQANYLLQAKQTENLKEYISNIKEIEKDNLLSQTKSKFHNLLGQRVSIIQCILNDYYQDNEIDMKLLKEKLLNTLKDINSVEKIDFNVELENLINTFHTVGFNIVIDSNINQYNYLKNKYFIDIIRECATNALSHANANNLYVNLLDENNVLYINIYDNKKIKLDHIIESTGIKAIREDTMELNGVIQIDYLDGYQIKIVISK